MQCNIDEKGARYRRVYGILNVMVGLIGAGLAWWSGYWWLGIIAGVCILVGVFAIYEAHKKWCVMRAVGIKTKI